MSFSLKVECLPKTDTCFALPTALGMEFGEVDTSPQAYNACISIRRMGKHVHVYTKEGSSATHLLAVAVRSFH